jgi:hypothetical protein
MSSLLRAHGSRFGEALRAGLAWRPLALFTLGLLVPTGVAAIPLRRELGDLLDRSPRSPEFAHRFDMLLFQDVTVALGRVEPALIGAGAVGTAVALILGPWLTGMMMAATSRAGPLGVGLLLQSGLAWYGRALRIWLVSLLPLAFLGVVVSMASKSAGGYAERALLEAHAMRAWRAVAIGTAILFVLVHAVVEASRAELAADPELRSAFRALARAARHAARHPVAVLSFYLGTTAASFLAAALLCLVRLHISAASAAGLGGGFVVTQLAVACIGWGKLCRLFALTALARSRTGEAIPG